MATSGTYTFDPTLNEVFDEAFERAGVDPSSAGIRHLKSAFRSLKFMLNAEWPSYGEMRWAIPQGQQVTTPGMTNFTLPAGAIDIVGMVLRRAGKDIEMYPIGREDYLTLTDKNLQGRPDRYFMDLPGGLTGRICYIWQAGSNSSDILVYNYMRQMQDAGAMQNTLDMPPVAQEALVAGLAAKLAWKFNRDLYATLRGEYVGTDADKVGGAVERMRQATRERSDVDLMVDMSRSTSQFR